MFVIAAMVGLIVGVGCFAPLIFGMNLARKASPTSNLGHAGSLLLGVLLSLVILAGSYKLGWRVGLLAAVVSPLLNHVLTGMPAWGVLSVMMLKLVLLALIAGFTAQHFKKVTLPLIVAVVMAAELLGGLGELALTGGIAATLQDFTLGWPGLLLQVVGTYLICKYI